jgi:inhibitor of KinA
MTFRIVPVGDSAVTAELDERIDPAVNARAIALASDIQRAAVSGVRDIVPTFRGVTVYFDPLRTNAAELVDRLKTEAGRERGAPTSRTLRIPVCYGGPFGPDLDEVASWADLEGDEVIGLHSGRTYRVFMLGFTPGFAYMASVDPRIAAPRRPTPRARVPAGSVAVAGIQTGIYPAETPGGWRIIGRTPVRPFDPVATDPFLFSPGDGVQFFPIEPDEYERTAGLSRDIQG